MILRIFLDEFCKLRRERCGHRDRRYLAKIAKKILEIRVYKNYIHKFKQFLKIGKMFLTMEITLADNIGLLQFQQVD